MGKTEKAVVRAAMRWQKARNAPWPKNKMEEYNEATDALDRACARLAKRKERK